MTQDEIYMQRCIDLANNALGRTYPNPLVGAVIVYNGKIIGEGYHKRAGEPHAEVIAINSVKDKSLLPKSTLYVNLEPCSHYGRTPPCTDLIIRWKIPKVVVGTIDTSAKVSGKGIKKLLNAGIDVKVGILEEKARWLNRRFFTFHEKKRPYIIIKIAQTADGYIDIIRDKNAPRKPTIITSLFARTLVHKWRSQEQAIAVGTNTIIADNPSLTVRYWVGKNPIRICVDINKKIPKSSKIFDNSSKTICLTEKQFANIQQVIRYLYDQEVQSLFVEGGAKFAQSFIDANLWDEIRLFVKKDLFLSGINSPLYKGKIIANYDFKNETLFILKNEKSS